MENVIFQQIFMSNVNSKQKSLKFTTTKTNEKKINNNFFTLLWRVMPRCFDGS